MGRRYPYKDSRVPLNHKTPYLQVDQYYDYWLASLPHQNEIHELYLAKIPTLGYRGSAILLQG